MKEGLIISIDGKPICGAGAKEDAGRAHMLSVCLRDESISLGLLMPWGAKRELSKDSK